MVFQCYLEYLPQREVLKPGVLVGRLHLQRSPGEENGVIEVLQVKQHARQIQEHLATAARG